MCFKLADDSCVPIGYRVLCVPSLPQVRDYGHVPENQVTSRPVCTPANYKALLKKARCLHGTHFDLATFVDFFKPYGKEAVRTALGAVAGYLAMPDAIVRLQLGRSWRLYC